MWKRAAAASWGMPASLQRAVVTAGTGDLRLCFLKVTSAGDGQAQGRSRAAPWLAGKLDTICSASIVCCWSQFPSAGPVGGTGLSVCDRDAEDAGQGQRRLPCGSVLLGCEN